MKSLSKLLMSFATVVMAFASCEQVVEESVPQNDFVYTFTLGSADETKATIGENSVVWEEGDQMGVYTISTSGTSYNRYGDITPGTPATMEISSYYALAAGDMVYAYYPYTSNNSKEATTVSMSIPTSQDGKDDMPMVSLPIAMASDLEEKTDMNLPAGELKFVNLAAVIEFNVYSTTAEYQSEKIQSVSFVADQAIAGSFTYDLSKVNYSDPATLTISGYEETTVVYTPSTPAPVPAEKASATKIKMVVAPGSYTGKVIVTTDAATYTYNIEAAKEFVRSTIKPLNVELRENVRVVNPVDDEDLVIATGNLTSGSTDVLLEAGKAIMYSDIKGTNQNYSVYTPGRFYKDNIYTVKSYAGNIKEISITCESGYADDLSSSVSSLGSVTTSGNTVTLSLTTPSTTVTWTNSAQWRASTMSVTYVSSGEIAQMPRNLAFSASTANATVGQDFTEPTLSGNKTDDVTYSSSDTGVATVDAESGKVTLLAVGTTTITATAPETSEFKNDEVSYTLIVSEAPQGGGYTVIKTVSELTEGTYLMGGNNADKFAEGTMYLWSSAATVSGQKLTTASATYSSGDFTTDVSSYVNIELISTGASNVYYIKVGEKYLKGAVKAFSLVEDPIAWTFADMGGTKEGMYFYNTANNSYVFINSTTGAIRTYGSSTQYKGIYFFKAN